jgi:SAM-dependent methyltransferase
MTNIEIHDDYRQLAQVASDEQRKVMVSAVRKPFGKIFYVLPRLQLIPWKSYTVARRMLLMYLASKDYYIKSGIPSRLVNLAVDSFGKVKGKAIKTKLLDSILFGAVAWHIRFVRAFDLLKAEFEAGRNVESYGCGSGIIEILALIASGNQEVKLTLIDYDPDGIKIANELVAMFGKNGYDVSNQVEAYVGDINDCVPKAETDTVVSIGLVHNYFSLTDANEMMRGWFDSGITRVITDIYYNAEESDDGLNDAKLKILFVRNVLGWKVGAPDGLQFTSVREFAKSLPEYTIDAYNHSLNATMVVTLS